MISKLRYIIFIIILAIAIYYYIYNRTAGCKNKNALNYNPEADIGDEMKCIYDTLGCMDKNAGNYNKFSTLSCTEDCLGCEEKGTCDLCKNHRECKDECPECICKPKVKGCNRTWALNYDPKATDDNGSCISSEDFLKKISIVSGGDCKRCSSRASVKIGDKYPILGGKQGINLLVLKRNDNLDVRYKRSFMTGNYDVENKKFVDFMRKYVHYKDIVIITIRGDAVGRKRTVNSKKEPVYIDSILTDDAKMVLYELGARSPSLARQGSYILVGTFLNDIYYETYSSNSDSFYPYFNLTNFGCVNFNSPKFEKIELDMNKMKLLQGTGDINEAVINDEKSDNNTIYKDVDKNTFVDMNRVDNINRCALEVIQMGYKLFSVSKTKCYIYKVKDEFKDDIDAIGYFKNNQFNSYNKDNKYFRLSNNICRLNSQLLPYGNENEESIYLIDEVYYSGLFSMIYGGQMVEIYNLSEQRGIKRDVGIGTHQAWGTIPKAVDSKQDLIYLPITSMKIPNDFQVTLYRNILQDEDITKFTSYALKFEDDYQKIKKLDLSCCEGVKITTKETEARANIRELRYRIWKNIIKNLEVKREEVTAKLYIYDENVDIVDKRPEVNANFVLDKNGTFDLSTYKEIERLKKFNGNGKVGYIEFLKFNGKKTRKIEFSTWENFKNQYIVDIIKQWDAYYLANDGNYPKEGEYSIHVVDPKKKILSKTITLFGYKTGSGEVNNGFTHKKCNNIPKYGDCENNDAVTNPFTNDIKYLTVSKQNFGVTIYDKPDFQGVSLTLGYGKYNLPDDLCVIIRSIKVEIKYIVIKLYLDFNFKNEFIRLNHNSTSDFGEKFSYFDLNKLIPENKKIRSICIEKLDYYTIISNNPYPESYNSSVKYDEYQYPFKYTLSNNLVNNLDYCYDYFKDEINLDSNDKFVRFIRENYKYDKLESISQRGDLHVINSGGGIDYLRNKLGNNYNKLISGVKVLKTYDSSENFKRKIIIFNGKIMEYDGDTVIFQELDTLNFDKTERSVKLCETNNEENIKFNNHNNLFLVINNAIKQLGKYLAIKSNNTFVRINYDDLDLTNIINKKINLILFDENKEVDDDGKEQILNTNVTNSTSTEEFNLYIIRKPPQSDQVPEFCLCDLTDDEYNPNNFLYGELNRYQFNNIISTITLATVKNTLRELGIVDVNSYEILNNKNSSVYNNPPIVQILDNKFKITKTIYFNCHKYVIDDNINILNKIEKVGDNDKLNLSKLEKRADIIMRDEVDYNDNFQINYKKNFNLRQELNTALETNNQNNINLINNQIKDSGIIETYDINQKLIRKRIFSEGKIESFGEVKDISNLLFNPDEKILDVYEKNRKRILRLPIDGKVTDVSINSMLKGLMYGKNCFIKFYDINNKLIKVGLWKDNKFIFKKNSEYLSTNYKQYIGKFDSFNWIDASREYSVNLDEMFVSIELENGSEILYSNINTGNTYSDIDDLLKSFGYTSQIMEYNFRFFLKTKLYSIIRFYDYDNKITKKLKFSYQPINLNSAVGNERFPILLYDNPLQYIETYKNNIIYNCYQKDTLIISVLIPNGMKGIYSYKIDGKVVYVNKVISDNGKVAKLYDENDNLIIETDDINVHNYILGVKLGNYDGNYKLEYYPKINKTIIRILDKIVNVDKIVETNIDEIIDVERKDQLGNLLTPVKNRRLYVLDNNVNSLKVTHPDKTYEIKFIEPKSYGNF